jgi:hypothetical protein
VNKRTLKRKDRRVNKQAMAKDFLVANWGFSITARQAVTMAIERWGVVFTRDEMLAAFSVLLSNRKAEVIELTEDREVVWLVKK